MKLLLLLFPTLLFSQAVTSSVCYNAKDARTGANSPVSFLCAWITDTVGDAIGTANTVEYGTSTGVYTASINRPLPETLYKWHIVNVNAVLPATTYFARGCTTISAVKRCGSEHTITTGAASIDNNPQAPVEVDNFTSGTGAELLVGSDCEHGTTGLQARMTAASLGDVIKIPSTTVCAKNYTWPDKGAGTVATKITTSGTNLPPAGARVDCTLFDCAKIYRSYRNYLERNSGEMAALTGRLTSFSIPPGSIMYEGHVATWNVKKAAYSGSPIAILGASFATPIVLTVGSGHGINNNEIICAEGAGGNLAVNQCHQASSVGATTITLLDQTGNGRIGSGAYTSGGTFRPVAYTAITTVYTASGNFAGASCADYEPGDWGRNTAITNFDEGIFRCGTDDKWYPVQTLSNIATNPQGNQMFSAINMMADSHHLDITNVQFPETPIPGEPEADYAPRNSLKGVEANGTFFGARGSHHMRFNQADVSSNMDVWNVPSHFIGQTTNFSFINGRGGCGRFTQALGTENENPCAVVNMTNSIGTMNVSNNYLKSGGWCLFIEEGYSFTIFENLTFNQNYCDGVEEYNYGTSFYSKGTTPPKVMRTRQLFELKKGRRVKAYGNKFNFLSISASPSSPAFAIGTQGGSLNLFTIAVDGVVTQNTSYPLPLSSSANDLVVFYDSNSAPASDSPALFRVDTVTPFALKNLDGTAYSGGVKATGNMCNLSTHQEITDVDLQGNTTLNTVGFLTLFGSSYQQACEWAPVERVYAKNNFSDIGVYGQTGGWYGTAVTNIGSGMFVIDGLSNNVQLVNNSARNLVAANTFRKAFTSDFSTQYRSYGLDVQLNIFPANDYGILGVSGATGSTALNAVWTQGSTFTKNVFTDRSTLTGEPAGNANPTQSQVMFNPDGSLNLASPYYSYSANFDAIRQLQGSVRNIRISSTSSAVTVVFQAPNTAACSLDYSSNNWLTYTRVTSTGSTQQQTATFNGASKTTFKMRLICAAETVSGLQMSTK